MVTRLQTPRETRTDTKRLSSYNRGLLSETLLLSNKKFLDNRVISLWG